METSLGTASLATSAPGQEPKLVTCNTGLIFLADLYTDRVLMGEGYIVVTGADGHQYLVAVPGSAVRAKPIRCSLAERGWRPNRRLP